MPLPTGDDWKACHPGKGQSRATAYYRAIWEKIGKTAGKRVKVRQARSVSSRRGKVPVTLPRVSLTDEV